MAEQRTDIKNQAAAAELSTSIGRGLAEKVNPIEHTVDLRLPSAERNVSPQQTVNVTAERLQNATSNSNLQLDSLVANTPVESRTIAVSVDKSLAPSTSPMQDQLSLDKQHEEDRLKFSPNLNPTLNHEYFSIKPPTGYVNTILDTLMNLLAEMFSRLDQLIFGRKSGSKRSKKQIQRDDELEQFMETRLKESLNRQAMKKMSSEMAAKVLTERESLTKADKTKKDKLAEVVSLDQSWQDD